MKERDLVYAKLKVSKKYKHLCDDTLLRVAHWAGATHPPQKAEKAAKKKLHQIYGAFFERMNLKKIEKLLDRLPKHPDNECLKQTAAEILNFHTSTAERLPILAEFYRDLFSRTGTPKRVIDAACGLNPFAIQWMNLKPGSEYLGLDIDRRLIGLTNSFFSHFKRPNRAPNRAPYRAKCVDILVTPPGQENKADMIFFLKTLPTLEQQERGAGERLLKSLAAEYVVVSFPAASLCGHEKGMENHYRKFILDILNRLSLSYFKMEYPVETFYVISPG